VRGLVAVRPAPCQRAGHAGHHIWITLEPIGRIAPAYAARGGTIPQILRDESAPVIRPFIGVCP